MLQRFWNVMNPQTRIIVVTSVVLVTIDIALRLLIPTRVIQVNNGTVNASGGVLTVRALQIADDNGNVRATLDLDEGNEPALRMFDKNDALRLQLDTMQTVPSLMFFDQKDQRTLYLGNGTPGGDTYLDTNVEYDARASMGEKYATAGQTVEVNECTQ
jgi:hypothetical protein